MTSERNRVESCAVFRMIIVAAPADGRKTGNLVHLHGRVAVADFEMHSRYSVVSRAFQEVVEQASSDSLTAVGRQDREQQKFGLVRNRSDQREADGRSRAGLA